MEPTGRENQDISEKTLKIELHIYFHFTTPTTLIRMTSTTTKEIDLNALNTQLAPHLLIFTWKILHLVDAAEVKITALNQDVIGVSAVVKKPFSKAEIVDKIYSFSTAEKERYRDLSERVSFAVKKDSRPIFPFKGFHVINLWIVSIIAALPDELLFNPLLIVKSYLLYVFRTEQIAQIVLLVMLGLHLMESVVVWYLLSPIVTKPSALLHWLFYDLLVGIPITERVWTLSTLHKHSKVTNKSK